MRDHFCVLVPRTQPLICVGCSVHYYLPNHFTETVFSCERRDLVCSHNNGDIFTCENNMLFSLVQISCFRAKDHLVFHWCLYYKLHHVKTENPSFRMTWLHWTTQSHPVTRTNGNNVDPLFVQTYPSIQTLVDILGLYSVTPSTKLTNTYRQSEANF